MSEHATREVIRELVSFDRMAQFAAVGIVGTVVDIVLLEVFYGLLGVGLVVGKLIAAETSFQVMFVINERWTFSEFSTGDIRSKVRRLVLSNVVRLAGLATAVVVLVALTWTTDLWYQVANAIGIGAGFVVNYSCESRFTWRIHDRS